MNATVTGLKIEEREGASVGVADLRTAAGPLAYPIDVELAKKLRIGQQVELRLIRTRGASEGDAE